MDNRLWDALPRHIEIALAVCVPQIAMKVTTTKSVCPGNDIVTVWCGDKAAIITRSEYDLAGREGPDALQELLYKKLTEVTSP